MMRIFEWLDDIRFLNIQVWDFSFRSLGTDYGRDFLTRVIFRHPLVTLAAIGRYRKHYKSAREGSSSDWKGGPRSIVGAGFCLKPLSPACISGRSNHDCFFFERNLQHNHQKTPECCKHCKIREIGEGALEMGSNLYIMTSALDILYDMFLPALEENRFTDGLFTMCRYSFEPFKLALLVSGIEGKLFPFETGDCRDHAAWLQADTGNKDEQTALSVKDEQTLQACFSERSSGGTNEYVFQKHGNIFYSQ